MSLRKKLFFISFIFLFAAPIFSYEKVSVILPYKTGSELHTSFYCFNDLKEGKEIAEEIFHVKNFNELARDKRERMIPVPLGTNVGYYDWAIFSYGYELWLFEIKNGFLWGRGMMLSEPHY